LEEVMVMAHRRYFTALHEVFEKYKHKVGHAGDDMVWSSPLEPLSEEDWLAFVKRCEQGRGARGAVGAGAGAGAAEKLGSGSNDACRGENEVPPPAIPGPMLGTQEFFLVGCFFLGVFAIVFVHSGHAV
jgi:hypothetical protein